MNAPDIQDLDVNSVDVRSGSEQQKILRIFISSPSDVSQERQRAREVIDSLRRRYVRHFILKPVFWEDLPLESDMSFQQGIDTVISEHGVDIAVFIFWSRLGTPLGALIRRPDGTEYRSGTEREYDLMLRARMQTRETEGLPRPALLVYTRRDDASFVETLRAARNASDQKKLLEQKQLVDSFLAETFKDQDSGTNIGAYFPFDRPVTFSQRLRTHLQSILDRMAGQMHDVIWDCEQQGPPFLGLDAFQQQHTEIFFGREQETLEARNALKHQASIGSAFLLISGASGSGKSSMVRAGLLPEIISHELDDQISEWHTLVITPSELGADPLLKLIMLLSDQTVLPELRDHCASLEELARDLADAPESTFRQTIALAVESANARHGGGLRILLVIDQLEEIFTMAMSLEQRTHFLALIEVMARSRQFWVVATVRSDFYPQIQSEKVLVRLKEGRGLFDLLPPSMDAIQRLIEEPARLAGLHFEERDGQSLSGCILRDAASHAELLPLLEFVLLELYSRRDDQNRMTFAAYAALGGVDGAIARRAEETFASVSGEAQQSLGFVLQSLVTLGEDNAVGDAEKAVRLHAPLDTFDKMPGAKQLIQAFTDARVFTKGHAEENPTVTLAHEALLRVWPRANEWCLQNLDFLRTRARISVRMKEGSPLLKGDPLFETAKAFLSTHRSGFNDAQRAWITNEVMHVALLEKSATRRSRMAFTTLAIFAIAAVISAFFALGSRKQAVSAKEDAVKQHVISEAARATAELIVSDIMGDLGKKLKGMNQFSLLEPASAASLNYFEQIPIADRTAETRKITAGLQMQRADILYRLGRFKEAEPLLTNAREYFSDPSSAGFSEDQVNKLNSMLAKCKLQIGNTANAREELKGVKEQLKEVKNDKTQHTPKVLTTLFNSAIALAWLELVDNNYQDALELAEDGNSLLVDADSAHLLQESVATNFSCKFAELRCLSSILLGKQKEMPAVLQAALSRAKELSTNKKSAEKDRWLVGYQGRLYGLLGDCYLFAGNNEGAQNAYQQSLEFLLKASTDKSLWSPDDEIQSDVWLGFSYVRMGIVSLAGKNRDFVASQNHFDNAKLTLDKALKGDEVDDEMGKTLMRVMKNAAPVFFKNTPSLSKESKLALFQILSEFQQRY